MARPDGTRPAKTTTSLPTTVPSTPDIATVRPASEPVVLDEDLSRADVLISTSDTELNVFNKIMIKVRLKTGAVSPIAISYSAILFFTACGIPPTVLAGALLLDHASGMTIATVTAIVYLADLVSAILLVKWILHARI
jgi:hypothetical protein